MEKELKNKRGLAPRPFVIRRLNEAINEPLDSGINCEEFAASCGDLTYDQVERLLLMISFKRRTDLPNVRKWRVIKIPNKGGMVLVVPVDG